MGHVCESWKVTRSLCDASALTTKGLSAVLMMGQSCTQTSLCSQTYGMLSFTRLSLIPVYSKIKVWDLQAALDPRAPASTLCLRTLVVRGTAILFVFLLTSSFWLVSRNLGYLCSSSDDTCSFLSFFFLPGTFWASVPSSVWWVSDHQQFSWWHHSDLGFPERLNQWPARGAVSLPHLHVYF